MTDPAGPTPRPPSPPLDAYVDNLVESADRARVERDIAADPRAAAELALQRQIDDSLHRLFDTGAPQTLPMPAHSRRALWLGLAAAIAILVSGAAIYMSTVLGAPRPDVGAVYLTQVSTGFKPAEVCTTPDAFAGWVTERYGAPLYPTGSLDGVTLVGWSYASVFSGYTGVLLADVDHRHVVVVLDKADKESRRPGSPSDSSLHVYRARIGPYVLYEVSPLPTARILPALTATKG